MAIKHQQAEEQFHTSHWPQEELLTRVPLSQAFFSLLVIKRFIKRVGRIGKVADTNQLGWSRGCQVGLKEAGCSCPGLWLGWVEWHWWDSHGSEMKKHIGNRAIRKPARGSGGLAQQHLTGKGIGGGKTFRMGRIFTAHGPFKSKLAKQQTFL